MTDVIVWSLNHRLGMICVTIWNLNWLEEIYLRGNFPSMPKTEVFTLLFTEEGYENAKELLCQSYGNASEILHAQG